MKILRRTLAVLFALSIIISNVSLAFAATGKQGYAVYRDGAFMGLNWHAALMDEPSISNTLPIIHHSGSGYVKFDSWSNFLKGNNFKGYYRPKSNPSSSRRDSYKSISRRLISSKISYNVAYQIYYSATGSNTWVFPENITSIRCDGVVEYTYEYFGDRVYGNNSYWDISRKSTFAREHHSGGAITPKMQTEKYLTKVS